MDPWNAIYMYVCIGIEWVILDDISEMDRRKQRT
jgi:hypothetical protein